jgi:hypothetical protein
VPDRPAIGDIRLISQGGNIMKRSRRVVLTLMGSAALSAAARPLSARPIDCGPGLTAVPGANGVPYCRAIAGGFGGSFQHFHGHAHGHGHAGG